jgi:hypothetical protein
MPSIAAPRQSGRVSTTGAGGLRHPAIASVTTISKYPLRMGSPHPTVKGVAHRDGGCEE